MPSLRAATSTLLNRIAFMRQAGLGYEGARDYYTALGYDREISTKQYRDEYARGGIAKRIVEAFPKATWRGGVELFEDEDPKVTTAFEQVWQEHFEKRLNVWSTFLKADILAGLSTYSVILIGDGGDLSAPLSKGSPEKLLYLQPYGGGGGVISNTRRMQALAIDSDTTISEWETDVTSPRFGEPKTYQLRRTNISSPAFQRPIHWSRIIHVAEGCLEDNVFGIPTLENIWNHLQDLMKIAGGGSEAFWLRANQGLNLNLDKDVSLAPGDADKLKDEVDEYRHNISRVLKTRGMDVNTLGSDVANFSGPIDSILQLIAGSKGIPMRILTGSERGELASTQDAANFNTQVQDRRTNYAGPLMVRRLVDRMIEFGFLPTPKQYDVFWPTVQTMSDTEKAQGAQLWAATNQTAGAPVYTISEIREHWQGLKPLTPEQVEEMVPASEEPVIESVPEDIKTLRAMEAALESGDRKALGELLHLEDDTLHALEAAIEADDLEGIAQIVGLDV